MSSLAHTITAKSDQLNADDLVGGPITVKIEGVTVREDIEQPVTIKLSGGFRPWKPCKTERRVLVHAWGDDGDKYVGRTLELVRDNNVKWAGQKVGGVRIQRMSDLTAPIEISLAASRQRKEPRRIGILEGSKSALSSDPFRDTLLAATRRAENPWTPAQIHEWLLDKRKASDIPSYERPEILARLQGPPCERQEGDGLPF